MHTPKLINKALDKASALLSMAVAVLSLAVMAACSDVSIADEPVEVPEPGTDVEVTAGFYITVGDIAGGNGGASRSTVSRAPSAGYDPGVGYENYFDIEGGDYKFLFFTGEDEGTDAKFITEMEVTSVIPVQFTQYSKTYKVTGSVPQRLLTTSSFRVMVLANWKQYPTFESGVTTIDAACSDANAMFSYTADCVKLDSDHIIPLYGIQRFDKVQFNALDYTDLGTIHLLRAYAKVDVQMPEDEARWRLKSVELTRWHDGGYKAPLGVYDRSDYVKDAYDLDYTGNPSVITGTKTDLKFIDVNKDGTLYRAYVPEFRNITTPGGTPLAERTQIRVQFYDKNTGFDSYLEPRYIDFKYYDAPEAHPEWKDKHFNVMRNYWYKFTINKGDETTDLKIKVDVQPYSSVELDPMFGLERDPIDGYIILKKNIIDGNPDQPTFMYDDRFGDYYDFQKYMLQSNYGEQITRLTDEEKIGNLAKLKGDIWVIKRANGQHDGIGSASAKPSLLYDASTGMYFDFDGTALNLVYSNKVLFGGDTKEPLDVMPDSVTEVDRDFQHNDMALLRGESDRVAVYYDFSDAKYKGATDFDLMIDNEYPREILEKHHNGWIEVKPYQAMMQKWVTSGLITDADKANVKPMYFNIYTKRFYDTEFYSLHSPGYEVKYFVDSPFVALVKGEVTVYYNRVTGEYKNAATASGSVIPRPNDLRESRVPLPAKLQNIKN